MILVCYFKVLPIEISSNLSRDFSLDEVFDGFRALILNFTESFKSIFEKALELFEEIKLIFDNFDKSFAQISP